MSVEHELRQVIVQLGLCSHVSAVNFDPSSRDAGEDIGGKRPPGGLDRKEDGEREPGRMLKSAEHFRRRLARARSERALTEILADAEASLSAWRRQPPPKDKEHPMPGEFNWKRWVGESKLSVQEIANKCYVSPQYVGRVRKQYREAA
jgi:hypothetical protein